MNYNYRIHEIKEGLDVSYQKYMHFCPLGQLLIIFDKAMFWYVDFIVNEMIKIWKMITFIPLSNGLKVML